MIISEFRNFFGSLSNSDSFYITFLIISENFPGQNTVNSRDLEEEIVLEFPPEVVRILIEYSEKVKKFGLEISTKSNKITVTRVPECFVQRNQSELKYRRPSSLRNLVTNLFEEISAVMVETRGGFGLLPKTIGNVLNSQACRGKQVNSYIFLLFRHLSFVCL
jgi:DNA mismatch repair ATPase MutL